MIFEKPMSGPLKWFDHISLITVLRSGNMNIASQMKVTCRNLGELPNVYNILLNSSVFFKDYFLTEQKEVVYRNPFMFGHISEISTYFRK